MSVDGKSWLLVNASPDILAQLRAFPEAQPARALRDTAIVGIALVDSQIDHTAGLLMLREGAPLAIYCTDSVRTDLSTGHPLFRVLEHYCRVDWRRVDTDGTGFAVQGLPGLSLRAIPLQSKAPPYSAHRHEPREGDNVGLLLRDETTGATLFYAPGLGRMEAHLHAIFGKADCLLLDGTFWTDDEMLCAGIAGRSARDMGHLPLAGPGGMLEVLAGYPRPRKVLIHINNTNPILDDDSRERAELAAAGIEVACDGMRLEI